MRPTIVDVEHYRALRSVRITLDDYTALVGPNGVGKSTVLQALRFFFMQSATVGEDDQQRGCNDPVSVTVTFADLTSDERESYASHLATDGTLSVTKQCALGQLPAYFVRGMRYAGFDAIRIGSTSKSEFNDAFKRFVDEHPEMGLQKQRSADLAEGELQRWEAEHLDECAEAPVPFRFLGSTKTQLIPSLHVVYVPAVQEASTALGESRSPLAQMIDALVHPEVEEKPELVALREELNERYQAIFPAGGTEDFKDLTVRLNTALKAFVPNASVELAWGEEAPVIPIPGVVARVSENGVVTPVERKGHGLQRATIIAMLQAENEYRREQHEEGAPIAHVLFLIEEPELYQHPPMARHFRTVLRNLTEPQEGGAQLQVALTTHSPDFISLEAIDGVRILRYASTSQDPYRRKITSATLADVARAYQTASGKELNEDALRKRLHIVDPIIREAFFAAAVVLVEGVGDVGLISAQCEASGVQLEEKGIVLVPCDGKGKMTLPVCVLALLNLRFYAIFDADSDQQENRTLLTALGDPRAVPLTKTKITDTHAVLAPKVEVVARNEFTPLVYDACTQQTADIFGTKPEQVLKNTVTAKYALDLMHRAGARSASLEDIVQRIGRLV